MPMKKENGVFLALLLVLLLCLGVAIGILAARLHESLPVETPTPEPTLTPEPTPEPIPSLTPEECGHPAYENGVCVLCGHACEHPFHSTEGECLICGSKVVHHYVNALCSCGRSPDFRVDLLPDRFYEPCEQEGTTLSWSFETVDWSRQMPVTMEVSFYLPYDYDPAQRYNVLVLLHGLRATQESWLNTPWELEDGREIQMRWIYDRMIAEKIIDPLIIVSASQYLYRGEDFYKSKYEQMAYELQNVILPYTVENFSTYAEDGSPEALIAAREHFALGGNSWGSYYTYDTGMCQSLAFFSRFLCFSGDANSGWIVESLGSAAQRDYPIALYYAAAGDYDVALKGEQGVFYSVVPLVERLRDGENAFFHICHGGHDWGTWSIEIYNALQLLY